MQPGCPPVPPILDSCISGPDSTPAPLPTQGLPSRHNARDTRGKPVLSRIILAYIGISHTSTMLFRMTFSPISRVISHNHPFCIFLTANSNRFLPHACSGFRILSGASDFLHSAIFTPRPARVITTRAGGVERLHRRSDFTGAATYPYACVFPPPAVPCPTAPAAP